MKIFLFLLSFILITLDASSQYSRVIIQLKDKAGSNFSLSNPSQFLSARAIQRRTRFNIAYDSTDLPVTKSYVDSIKLAGNVIILSQSKWLNQVLIKTTDPAALAKIQSFPFVKSVAAVAPRSVTQNVTDKFKETVSPLTYQNKTSQAQADYFNYGQNYNQVHIHQGEYLHNKGYRGENIQITVLDAGFRQYQTITAFDSVRLNGQILGERDFVTNDNSVNEDDTHGMWCLSIICANWPGKMVGTAPKAKFWLIRTEDAPTEYIVEEHYWVAGAEFADSTGSDMISSSLGYLTFNDPAYDHSYNDFYKNAAMVSKGAAFAAKKGMIVMNSAGNEGGNSWKYLGFPADADSVCAVGAVNNAGMITNFSSHGYPGKIKPNIVSVGGGTVIAGNNNQPVSGNGTSFSNPNVAGLVACLWQAFPAVSNMKLLDAVYKSADRYSNPDSLYGFGIPNFRKAYVQLKHEQNLALYGTVTLWATPDSFMNFINAKFISGVDGGVSLFLKTVTGQVIAKQNFVAEKEEMYNHTFTNLAYLPEGDYIVEYTDSATSRSVIIKKLPPAYPDWLVVFPNPFQKNLTVYYKAPVSGTALFRLVDAKGSLIETRKLNVVKNSVQTFQFTLAGKLMKGVYYLQYSSSSIQKRVLRLVKS